ncbi:Uncharacterised protein [Chlamydia trachomatis]|nr:Uncharacterised protein [Chlamydia trachomatis]
MQYIYFFQFIGNMLCSSLTSFISSAIFMDKYGRIISDLVGCHNLRNPLAKSSLIRLADRPKISPISL